MIELNANWITEGLIDFEYKKYLLLGYLKEIQTEFNQTKLYPGFSDLVNHYRLIQKYTKQKEEIRRLFPRQLNNSSQSGMLQYEPKFLDDEILNEITKIVDYSLPLFELRLSEGKEIYDWIENQLILQPVGLLALDEFEGYLLLNNGGERKTTVFSYNLSIFENADEKYRGLKVNYVNSFSTGIHTTYENIKINLVKKQDSMKAPSVFLIESGLKLPFNETFLPIAKRMLVKYLSEKT